MKVVDTNTGGDITRNILLQIIIEQESEQNSLLSNKNLEYLIRCSSNTSCRGFSTFIDRSLEFFHNQLKLFQSQTSDRVLEESSLIQFWREASEKNLELWKSVHRDFFKTINRKDDQTG